MWPFPVGWLSIGEITFAAQWRDALMWLLFDAWWMQFKIGYFRMRFRVVTKKFWKRTVWREKKNYYKNVRWAWRSAWRQSIAFGTSQNRSKSKNRLFSINDDDERFADDSKWKLRRILHENFENIFSTTIALVSDASHRKKNLFALSSLIRRLRRLLFWWLRFAKNACEPSTWRMDESKGNQRMLKIEKQKCL